MKFICSKCHEELESEEVKAHVCDKSFNKPVMIESPNLDALKKICSDFLNDVENEDYLDEGYYYYIFETAIETFYGKEVWNFINSKRK